MKPNYTKLVIKIKAPPKTEYREKDIYYTARGQWSGLNYINLIFDKKQLHKRCILLKHDDEILVTGTLENKYSTTKKMSYCSLNVKYFRYWKD